LLLSQAFYK